MVSQVLENQIKTLDKVNKTCASIPDLVAKAQEDEYRSRQILRLLSSISNYDADIDRISEGVKNMERSAKGMRAHTMIEIVKSL